MTNFIYGTFWVTAAFMSRGGEKNAPRSHCNELQPVVEDDVDGMDGMDGMDRRKRV
jgi:hypothetical protein